MNFFSSAVDRLETIVAALGTGLQAWGELKNGEKYRAIVTEFINRRLARKRRVNELCSSMYLDACGYRERAPPLWGI